MAGPDEDFLSRWSRRKREARSGASEAAPAAAATPAGAAVPAPAHEATAPPAPLPPVSELTPESDFTAFMDAKVEPGVRREALKKLFADPRFNVMDGLDTYIDDYSIPDPLPEEWLGKLSAMAGLGDVPGRQKAEREARELAERRAQPALPDALDGTQGGKGGEGGGTRPPTDAVTENRARPDESQAATPTEPAACATTSIPSRKLGD